jgi:hypothetical protein
VDECNKQELARVHFSGLKFHKQSRRQANRGAPAKEVSHTPGTQTRTVTRAPIRVDVEVAPRYWLPLSSKKGPTAPLVAFLW